MAADARPDPAPNPAPNPSGDTERGAAGGFREDRPRQGSRPRSARAPGALPLLGHLPQLCTAPLRFFGSLAAHGDLVEIGVGTRKAYVVCHPELAHQVLADGRTFDRTGRLYDRVRAGMGNGLGTCPHADHRRQRQMMQPAFRPEHMSRYAALMREEVAATTSRWSDGCRVDLVDELFTLTSSVALRTLFTAGLTAPEAAELRESLDIFLKGAYFRALLPGIEHLPTRANRRYARAVSRWRTHVIRIIDEYRGAGVDHHDLLSRMLAARDEAGHGLSPHELRDQVAVLILGGAETTSAALSWALYLLAEHPDVEAELHAEVDSVIDPRASGLDACAGWEDLPRLIRTTQVVQEALRLFPPAWALPRSPVRDVRLADRIVPAGTLVVLSPYAVHRRPDLYPQPERFRPDRWSPDPDARRPAAPRGAFLPFGAGANKCIGESFALAESVLALATITARWRPRPVPGVRIRPEARSVLAPRSLPVRMRPR